jgi:tripartite-type tricarboxylate transporter receptor subunit TctC
MKPASLRALAARLLVAASVMASCTLALADTTPLRILVGFPAGGSTDLIARQLAAGLQTELARPARSRRRRSRPRGPTATRCSSRTGTRCPSCR